MAVNYQETNAASLLPIGGIGIFVGQAGVKKPQHDDLTLLTLSAGCTIGAVFTQNRFCAAPVRVCKRHLAQAAHIRALVVNTGNANAGTGEEGYERAVAVCAAAAKQGRLQNGGGAAVFHRRDSRTAAVRQNHRRAARK